MAEIKDPENTVIIELRDVTSAGLTISTLFDAGANKVEGPRFNIDEATYQRAASEGERLALEDARRQAENLAGALGMRVSRVLRVSNREIDFNREYGVRRGGGLIMVTGSRVTTSPTPLEPGEIDFEVELFVEFALVPT